MPAAILEVVSWGSWGTGAKFSSSFHSSFAFLLEFSGKRSRKYYPAEGSRRETERPKIHVTIIVLTIFTNITGNDKL